MDAVVRAGGWLGLGILAAWGCGDAQRSGFDGDSGPTGAGQGDAGVGALDDASSGGDVLLFGDGSVLEGGSPAEADGGSCPANAQMVYVTGEPAELWSFWPPTFTFTKIGNLTCTDAPTHMTVDRTGTAWVVGDGNVYKTSTTTAVCSLAAKWQPQAAFPDFAVSFVGVTNGDTSLYLLGQGNNELGLFDIASGSFQTIGTPAVAGSGGDMTSIGDGKLWYLEAYTTPHPLYQIDPSTANVLQTLSVSAAGVGSQALAYFGARFYAFENNIVYEYDPKTGAIQALGNAPLQVTGAGQSTCVPTVVVDAGTPPPVQ
jgi:hypothetical protein